MMARHAMPQPASQGSFVHTARVCTSCTSVRECRIHLSKCAASMLLCVCVCRLHAAMCVCVPPPRCCGCYVCVPPSAASSVAAVVLLVLPPSAAASVAAVVLLVLPLLCRLCCYAAVLHVSTAYDNFEERARETKKIKCAGTRGTGDLRVRDARHSQGRRKQTYCRAEGVRVP